MHPTILAKRELDAQKRILTATETLAARFGIATPASVQERYPEVAQMRRWEVVAAFLDALVALSTEERQQRIQAAMNSITQRWALPVDELEAGGVVTEELLVAFLEMMAMVEPGPRIGELLAI
ncbi:MAG: hypothetical protein KF832_12590, partial [Caldilineaceae bacterium]|nr:hypothetical protein [Caldilineaceae bacterium]